jgi:hypothetical protein
MSKIGTFVSQVWQVCQKIGSPARLVWRVLRKFGECRLDCFIHIKYVFCAENDIPLSCALWHTHVFARLTRLADIRQTVLSRLAKLASTFLRVLARVHASSA